MFSKEKEFEKNYEAYSEPIFRYCYFRIFDRERSKEIMQEAFMKTWKYIAEGNEVKNFQAFVYKVAHNLVVNELERRKQTRSIEEIHEEGHEFGDESLVPIERQSEINLMLSRIKKLDDESREILIMKHVDDLSIEDIADMLKVSKNVVSVRLHRAQKKLKEVYDPKNNH